MNGKGSKRRPEDYSRVSKNLDAIDWGRKKKKKVKKENL